MRRKIILLCTTVMFLVVLSIVLVFLHKRDTRDGYQTPFTTNTQANIVSSGDFLYYCDVRQNKALCSYNLKTQKIQCLLKKAGELKQTTTAIYYIANQEIYLIDDNTIQKIYSVPNRNFDFIDIVNGSVYWISYDRIETTENNITSAPVYKLCLSNPTDNTLPKILWEQDDVRIRDAVYFQEHIYTLTDQGIYRTQTDSQKTEKISDFNAEHIIYSEAFLLFKHASGDSMHGYYEITKDFQTRQKSAVIGSVATIYGETLYYPFSETLWSVNLSSEERTRNNEGQLPGYPWSAIHATASGVFLRCHLTADIWFYEFETKELNCIIPQQTK